MKLQVLASGYCKLGNYIIERSHYSRRSGSHWWARYAGPGTVWAAWQAGPFKSRGEAVDAATKHQEAQA